MSQVATALTVDELAIEIGLRETKLLMPPVRVWHASWERNKTGNIGLMLAIIQIGDRELAWVIPPGSRRPLTFDTSSLTDIGEL